jgi:phage shock protein PspC (stress-responsive transcriptional regulator)
MEPHDTHRTLVRPVEGRILAGVATGLADYLGLDANLVRLGFCALVLFGGLGLPLYVAGWLLLPETDGGPTVAEDLLGRLGLTSRPSDGWSR